MGVLQNFPHAPVTKKNSGGFFFCDNMSAKMINAGKSCNSQKNHQVYKLDIFIQGRKMWLGMEGWKMVFQILVWVRISKTAWGNVQIRSSLHSWSHEISENVEALGRASRLGGSLPAVLEGSVTTLETVMDSDN